MKPINRRRFLASATAATAATLMARPTSAAEVSRLNLAIIGPANRGGANLDGVASENIVAICDVDEANAAAARKRFPNAEFFTDYRKLFDTVLKKIDAVVVSTPDHNHAHPTMMALTNGKHVYCEKPLCHTVSEVRLVRKTAAAKKLVTQMGTQIHATDNYRRVVEIVKSGALGPISHVHVWNSSRPVGGTRAGKTPSAKFDVDLWLGPTPVEFFEVNVAKSGWAFQWPHFHWRWWWEFGGGTLADLGCHYMDLPFWALDLTAPTTVKATGRREYVGDNTTPDVMQVDYQFPAISGMHARPDVKLSWYHGVSGPSLDGKETYKGYSSAVMFVGEKGKLIADYGKYTLLPDEFAKSFVVPAKSIAASVGHHKEWIDAIKNGGTTTCNFDYSGGLTEAVLLGNVAYRSEAEIAWDAATARVTNVKSAAQYLSKDYRKGWTI